MKTLIGFASLAAVLGAVLFLHGVGGSSSASPFSISAAMAAAKCPDITDTNTHPLPYGALPTASLDPRTCAIDFGIPAGAPGAAGAVGPKGPTGDTGCCIEATTTINNTRSNTFRVSATKKCPGGTTVTGGGGVLNATTVKSSKSNSSFIWVLTGSGPTKGGNGWTAQAYPVYPPVTANPADVGHVAAVSKTKPPPVTLTVTAICKKT